MGSLIRNLSHVAESSDAETSMVVYVILAIVAILAAILLSFRDLFGSSTFRKTEQKLEEHLRSLANQGDSSALYELAKIEANGGAKLSARFNPETIDDHAAPAIETDFYNPAPDDWSKGRSSLIKAAKNGCVAAKERIAVMLMERGEPKSGAYWRELAEYEVPNALTTLGQGYLVGSHVLQSPREPFIAAKYFERAVARGSAIGKYMLGMCCRDGLGMEKDLVRARALFESAAEEGVDAALYALAKMRLTGEGAEFDLEKGYDLLCAAGAHGVRNAIDDLVSDAEKNTPRALDWVGARCASGRRFASATSARVYAPSDAEPLLKRAIERGYESARVNLGALYENQKRWDGAEETYRLGAECGVDVAAGRLGALYLTKRYRAKRGADAVELLKRGVAAGDGVSATELARLYARGEFVAQDVAEAFRLFKQGAEQGETPAMSELGERYWKGIGTSIELDEAIHWLSRATVNGDLDALNKLRTLAKKRKNARAACEVGRLILRDVAVSYFETGAPEIHWIQSRVASYWFHKAAKWGDAEGMRLLGDALMAIAALKRRGAKRVRKALAWYRRAAELGNTDAITTLGDCYATGCGVTLSVSDAVKRYEEAAERGNSNAMLRLAQFLYAGWGADKDVEKARQLARRAADAGNLNAKRWLDLYECDPKPDPLARPVRNEEFLTSL